MGPAATADAEVLPDAVARVVLEEREGTRRITPEAAEKAATVVMEEAAETEEVVPEVLPLRSSPTSHSPQIWKARDLRKESPAKEVAPLARPPREKTD